MESCIWGDSIVSNHSRGMKNGAISQIPYQNCNLPMSYPLVCFYQWYKPLFKESVRVNLA